MPIEAAMLAAHPIHSLTLIATLKDIATQECDAYTDRRCFDTSMEAHERCYPCQARYAFMAVEHQIKHHVEPERT